MTTNKVNIQRNISVTSPTILTISFSTFLHGISPRYYYMSDTKLREVRIIRFSSYNLDCKLDTGKLGLNLSLRVLFGIEMSNIHI